MCIVCTVKGVIDPPTPILCVYTVQLTLIRGALYSKIQLFSKRSNALRLVLCLPKQNSTKWGACGHWILKANSGGIEKSN